MGVFLEGDAHFNITHNRNIKHIMCANLHITESKGKTKEELSVVTKFIDFFLYTLNRIKYYNLRGC